MTSRKTSKPRTQTKSRSSTGTRSGSNALTGRTQQILIVAGILIAILIGGYYVLTGNDPLGLFTETPPAEPSLASPTAEAPSASPTVKQPRASPTPLAGSGGGWWEVYFTEPAPSAPDEQEAPILDRLLALIDGAQTQIHIAAFEFNLTPVAEALIAAQRRGVQVQWVTDDEYGIGADKEEEHGQFAMLKKARIPLRDDGRGGLMHNKFWIFDGQIVWTGSTNITQNCMFRNNNNSLIMHSPELAAIFEREFQEMWDGEFGPTSPSTADQQQVTIEGTPVQVLFAAEDEVTAELVRLVKGARQSVRFMIFSFTDDELAAAMLARAEAGVDVQGIFETRGSETEYSELFPLYCAGVPVRQDGNPQTFHHKVLIVDGQIVVTGSFNWSSNAATDNDENLVVLSNPDVAARYLAEFERRWAEAQQPEVKCD